MDLREAPSSSAQRHPWEQERFHFFQRLLSERALLREPLRILDVGAGDAWFSAQLVERLPAGTSITCWDESYPEEAVASSAVAQAGGVALVAQRPAARFDGLLLLDVLEHVEDDAGFLKTLVGENLQPGGWALISVPAWPSLFSAHDTFLHHFRRYRPAEGRALIEGAGLDIRVSGGLFHSLLLPRGLGLLRDRLLGASAEVASGWRAGPALTGLVCWALRADNGLSRLFSRAGLDVPGLSWWALCTGPR